MNNHGINESSNDFDKSSSDSELTDEIEENSTQWSRIYNEIKSRTKNDLDKVIEYITKIVYSDATQGIYLARGHFIVHLVFSIYLAYEILFLNY